MRDLDNLEYRWDAYQDESNKNLWHVTFITTHPDTPDIKTGKKKPHQTENKFIINLSENTISGDDMSAPFLIGFESMGELSSSNKKVDWKKESTVPLQQIKGDQK
ncbi:MAG: hypothetical protein LBV16_05705 [Elusimicrobiota bacterium]|jgi:hypothetical protein|nr:hypothetical protein [Elusimicrobiota bacterium]